MCCVILLLLQMKINRSSHTFTGRGYAGMAASVALTFSFVLPPTHPHNSCDVRWCQSGIPHTSPDTPVFLWHLLCQNGTHCQPANLHNSPVNDLHLLKIAPVLTPPPPLSAICCVSRCSVCFFVLHHMCVGICVCVGCVKIYYNCKGRQGSAHLPHLLLPQGGVFGFFFSFKAILDWEANLTPNKTSSSIIVLQFSRKENLRTLKQKMQKPSEK